MFFVFITVSILFHLPQMPFFPSVTSTSNNPSRLHTLFTFCLKFSAVLLHTVVLSASPIGIFRNYFYAFVTDKILRLSPGPALSLNTVTRCGSSIKFCWMKVWLYEQMHKINELRSFSHIISSSKDFRESTP